VQAFCDEHRARTTAERTLAIAEKVGCFTGRHAVNPFSGEAVPIWVANFAVAEYGTGALMAVPAHDERDHEFARAYGLPIRQVIEPLEGICDVEAAAYTADGVLMASGAFTGLASAAARGRMTRHAAATGFGAERTLFRLKDWGISRQRYWGTPIPVIHCDGCGPVPVPEADLPVRLPEGIPITGKGGSPLESVAAFVNVPCPRCGGPAHRDTDTMDTFIDSSWYYFRYCDPHNRELPFGPEANHWFPVDLYVGGVEHAALHLIYTRFFTKVLADLGLIAVREPVARHLSQGMVVDWSYRCPEHGYLAAEKRAGDWKAHPDQARCGVCDGPLEVKKEKMSKSKYNTVDPDYLLDRYGADTTRLFALFAAPPEKDMDWSDAGIEGCDRFLARVRRLADRLAEVRPPAEGEPPRSAAAVELRRKTHDTIRRVTLDIEERLHLNTPVAAIMELVNALQTAGADLETDAGVAAAAHEGLGALALVLSPFAPHLASEMWERLGREGDAGAQPWPDWDETLIARAQATVVIQVNGKLRARVELPAGSAESEVVAAARREANVAIHLDGKRLVKTIHVPDKLLNLVVA
jgi:leucyl-tRNA synthetase